MSNRTFLYFLQIIAIAIVVSTTYAGTEGNFSYEVLQRLNTPVAQSEASDWAGASINTFQRSRLLEYKAEADFRYYFTEKGDWVASVPELHITKHSRNFQLTGGRKIVDWSLNDRYWLLDGLNGRQAFTLLGEKQEGLSGLHYQYRFNRNIEAEMFFSYFYLPSMNPKVDIQNGKVISTADWVRTPPSYTEILGRVTPIYYELNRPKVSSVIYRKSLGLNLKYKWLKGSLSAYAIYKPENSLRSNADASYDSDRDEVVVIANPVVNHHMMMGIQGVQQFGDVKGIVSLDIDDPNAKLGKDFETLDSSRLKSESKVYQSEYFSVTPNFDREAYFTASANIERPNYELSFNFIQLLSKNERGSDDFFSETVKWKRTFGTKAKIMWSDSFFTLADYRFDLVRGDQIIKGEMDYLLTDALSLRVGIEMIKAPRADSYWSVYRANDTIFSSLNMLF